MARPISAERRRHVWNLSGEANLGHNEALGWTKQRIPRFALWSAGSASTADHAVFDRNWTVWERSPAIDKSLSTRQSFIRPRELWRGAKVAAASIEELLSLVDPGTKNPTLPGGHPS